MGDKYPYLDYAFIALIWLLIFGKNVFSRLLFLDYAYSTFFDFFKSLFASNFSLIDYPFHIFNSLLGIFKLQFLAFQLAVLIAMLCSFYFIKKLAKERLYAVLFALVYFFNPFVYSRIMVGQLGVLLAYLTLPVYVYFLFLMFESNSKIKSVILCVISYTLVSCFAPHFFAFNFMLFLIASFWLYAYHNENRSLKKYAKTFAIFVIFLFLLNSFWLFGFFSNPVFSVIDSGHEDFFSPQVSLNVPASAKIVGMWGFWREAAYITPYKQLPLTLFYPMLLLLIVLFLFGYSYFDKKANFFFTLFWIGLVFGAGAGNPVTKAIFDSLFNYIPFFKGFRDSHKFVSFICLAYAFFIPLAIIEIKEKLNRKWKKKALIILLAVFILAYTFPLIGLWNQVKSANYPESYYKTAEYMDSKEIKGYIIYLPWENYLTYNWTKNISSDGRISVPINKITKQEVIIGADSFGAESFLGAKIRECINSKELSCLQEQRVEYILKDICASYKDNYEWITQVESISELAYENECFEVYKLSINGPAEKNKIPLRFILGAIISLIILLVFIFRLIKTTTPSFKDNSII